MVMRIVLNVKLLNSLFPQLARAVAANVISAQKQDVQTLQNK